MSHDELIYLDHHATTPTEPVVLEAMWEIYRGIDANPSSLTHAAGRDASEHVAQSIERLAIHLGAEPDELVLTSGATEANNLAIAGVVRHPRQTRKRILSVRTEHPAVLEPLEALEEAGYEVDWLPIHAQGHPLAGRVCLERAAQMIDDSVALVTVMLANNEIGVLQPLAELAALCHAHGVWFHTDATQAVGRLPIDVDSLGVDLLSFSAHKFYGPKGIGGLYVRRRDRRVRLVPQLVGGGQQENRRGGTLPTAMAVGMATALDLAVDQMASETDRLEQLRDRFWRRCLERLGADASALVLNGPAFDRAHRLVNNISCAWEGVEGQSLMLATPGLCMSSGSACASRQATPSHVLQGLGMSVEQARSTLRIGLGRHNTAAQIDRAADWLVAAYRSLRTLT